MKITKLALATMLSIVAVSGCSKDKKVAKPTPEAKAAPAAATPASDKLLQQVPADTQVSQSLATVFPVSPGGIGTEQALLVYIFRNVTSKSLALSFSVGMRVTLIVVNAIVGFTAILLMTGTLHVRRAAEADRTGTKPAKANASDGR